jgi:hypothetical protein
MDHYIPSLFTGEARMSSLQSSLAIAGGVILAAVIAHNSWTARKNTLRQAQPEPESQEPQLEPALGSDTSPANFERTPPPRPHAEKHLPLDALIDVLVPITLDGTVSGEAVLAAMPATRRAGNKPYAIEGMNTATGLWEAPHPGARYQAFQAGVQLANRSGALNEIEYSEFLVKIQAFADVVNAVVEFPDMIEQVHRGRELDQFASAHDAQLSFTVRSRNAAWSPGYVHQHAGRLGFVPGNVPGRMLLPSELPDMPPILVLTFSAQAALAEDLEHAALHDVTLSLDVPQVSRTERPFQRMREVAYSLTTSMEGVLTDDNRRGIPESALDNIGADLDRLYDTLEQRDLAAGSPQARRLFS